MNRCSGHCAFTLGLWTNTHHNTAVSSRYFALFINLRDNPPRSKVSKITSVPNSAEAALFPAKPKPKEEATWAISFGGHDGTLKRVRLRRPNVKLRSNATAT